MFPAIEPDDVEALTRCIDHVVAALEPDLGDRPSSLIYASRPRRRGEDAADQGERHDDARWRSEAQLTGPGGPFEVVADVVDGRRDEGLQGPASRSLRVGRRDRGQRAATNGRSSSTATGGSRFAEFVAAANCVSASACRDASASATATGSRCCRPNNPEWCMTLLGHRRPRRGPRRPQRVVEDRRDRLRPAGLRRPGARRRPQAVRAHRRPLDELARPRGACSSSTPTRPTSATTPGSTASTS